jgi:hypothetical protein
MDTLETNLNGLDPTALPALVPGVENEFIKVNSSGTDYELSLSNTVPTPTAVSQVLNSTSAGGDYSWTNEPNANAFRAASGGGAGFMWGAAPTINNRLSCNTSTNTITMVAGSGVRQTWTQSAITLSLPTTISSSLSCLAITNDGAFNQTNGNTTNFGSSGTSNPVNIFGTLTANKITHNDTAGTSANATIQLQGINTGLYSSAAGTMNFTAGGTEMLNMTSSRSRTIGILELGRSISLSTSTLNAATTFSIFSSTNPFIFCLEPASGTIDLEFQAASVYYGNQQFNILTSTRAASGGSVRYRAQSETIHIANGTQTSITSNTFHTLAENRLHLVICNTDTSRFYLIQF